MKADGARILSDQARQSHDPRLQWQEAQAALAAPITRDRNATRYLVAHGARILFGTDTPSAPTFANQPGLNRWREMQRWVAAGVTPQQVFRAATLSNAEILGLGGDIGSVQTGKLANLLLLRADPSRTVDAYVEIVKVIVHGRVLDPADLTADRHGTM
jgi:imidazolonepropionase-like amidohydrolase